MKGVNTLILIGFCAFGSIVNAQEKHDHKNHSLEKFKKELNLSDDQVAKIQKINASYKDEKDALRSKMDEIRNKEKAEIEKILNPEQLKKLQELKEKRKEDKK